LELSSARLHHFIVEKLAASSAPDRGSSDRPNMSAWGRPDAAAKIAAAASLPAPPPKAVPRKPKPAPKHEAGAGGKGGKGGKGGRGQGGKGGDRGGRGKGGDRGDRGGDRREHGGDRGGGRGKGGGAKPRAAAPAAAAAAAAPQEVKYEPCVLVMRGIPKDAEVDAGDIAGLFAPYGEVKDVRIKDMRQGRYAFIDFAEDASVDRALTECPEAHRDKLERRRMPNKPPPRADKGDKAERRPRSDSVSKQQQQRPRSDSAEARYVPCVLELLDIPDGVCEGDVADLFGNFGAVASVGLGEPQGDSAGRTARVTFEAEASVATALEGAPPQYRAKLRRALAPKARSGGVPRGGAKAKAAQAERDAKYRASRQTEDLKTAFAVHADNLPAGEDVERVVALLTAEFTPLPGGVTTVDIKSARYGFVYFASEAGRSAAIAMGSVTLGGSVVNLSLPKSAPYGGKPAAARKK
jgi:hypothetical protein